MIGVRTMFALVLALSLLAPVGAALSLAAEDVKIALVAPLSGRWARQGQLKKMGAFDFRTASFIRT